jgi:hypothetical protein
MVARSSHRSRPSNRVRNAALRIDTPRLDQPLPISARPDTQTCCSRTPTGSCRVSAVAAHEPAGPAGPRESSLSWLPAEWEAMLPWRPCTMQRARPRSRRREGPSSALRRSKRSRKFPPPHHPNRQLRDHDGVSGWAREATVTDRSRSRSWCRRHTSCLRYPRLAICGQRSLCVDSRQRCPPRDSTLAASRQHGAREQSQTSPWSRPNHIGHASVRITLDLYSHVQESMSRTAADAIEEVFGGSAAQGTGI